MEWIVGGKWDNCNSIINKYIKKKKLGSIQNSHGDVKQLKKYSQ